MVFSEALRVERVEVMEGERERGAFISVSTMSRFLPYRELTELHLMEEREFLRVRTEFPFAAVNIITLVTVMRMKGMMYTKTTMVMQTISLYTEYG